MEYYHKFDLELSIKFDCLVESRTPELIEVIIEKKKEIIIALTKALNKILEIDYKIIP